MSQSVFQKILSALSYANVGTLSEFHRVIGRLEPLKVGASSAPALSRHGNVVPFPRGEARPAFSFADPLLPNARLKP
jgi:hypothetical protein